MAAKTKTPPAIDTIDDDLRAACADRDKAWRDLMVKDSDSHRAAWDAACAEVDGLLEMRHDMAAGEPLAY